jgi:hypothetical protein
MTASNTPFADEASYRAGIALILGNAERELRIFDRDLTAMGLEANAQVDVLSAFLAADNRRVLRIIVHDIAPLQTQQPRLLALLRDFSQQTEIRTTPERLYHLADCWVLADADSGVIRFHTNYARGKTVIALPVEISPWWQKASELADESEVCFPWAITGL